MERSTSKAFVAASWVALATGAIGFIIGLWRAEMQLNEKGFYFTLLLFGLFAVVSLQKSVRDRMEGLQVTDIYYSGLWNAELLPSEKGFYAFAFLLSLFGAITVQKNTRDDLLAERLDR